MDSRNYWDQFYKSQGGGLGFPSQFALMVLSAIPDRNSLIELGCGNGRDFRFLRHHFSDAVAIDRSVSAISYCRENDPGASYVCGEIKDLEIFLENRLNTDPVLIYGRFFLHAVSEDTQSEFLSILENYQNKRRHIYVALEYRTEQDFDTEKIYGNHERRFINHENLLTCLTSSRLTIKHQVLGRGYATFKHEDPMIGRVIACTRPDA